jgi:cytochrome c
MSTYEFCALVCLSLCAGNLAAQGSPDLGESVSAEELAAIDYAILPNGDGLPEGAGTAAGGAKIYRQYCFSCHGEGGTGGANDALAGGHGSLTSTRPQKTVGSFWPYATTVFDYVRRAMPLTSPGILSNDELYAVTAYILYLNDIVDENHAINAETLPRVKMPNRDNFVWDYAPGE